MEDRNVILKIRILGAQPGFLNEQVDLEIRSCTLNKSVLKRRVGASSEILLMGLRGRCEVTVIPASGFEAQSQLVDLPKTGSITIIFRFPQQQDEEPS